MKMRMKAHGTVDQLEAHGAINHLQADGADHHFPLRIGRHIGADARSVAPVSKAVRPFLRKFSISYSDFSSKLCDTAKDTLGIEGEAGARPISFTSIWNIGKAGQTYLPW